jgi:hypothetical protein
LLFRGVYRILNNKICFGIFFRESFDKKFLNIIFLRVLSLRGERIETKYSLLSQLQILFDVQFNKLQLLLIPRVVVQPYLNLVEFVLYFYSNAVDDVREFIVGTHQREHTVLPKLIAF